MSKIIQLTNTRGQSTYVEWRYLLDEGSLQEFESKIQSLSDQKWSKMKVSREQVQDAIRVLRSAPKVSLSDFSFWSSYAGDPDLAKEKWTQGLYAWPTPNDFSHNPILPPATSDNLSQERVLEIWSGLDEMMSAYQLFITTTTLLWRTPPNDVYHTATFIDMDNLKSTASIVEKINDKSVVVKDVSPMNGFWAATSYVVYMVYDENDGYEGYLGIGSGIGSLSTARSFRTVTGAKKAGKKATADSGGTYYVLEQTQEVGPCVHIQGANETGRMKAALVQRQNEQLTQEVDSHLSHRSPSQPQKSRRL